MLSGVFIFCLYLFFSPFTLLHSTEGVSPTVGTVHASGTSASVSWSPNRGSRERSLLQSIYDFTQVVSIGRPFDITCRSPGVFLVWFYFILFYSLFSCILTFNFILFYFFFSLSIYILHIQPLPYSMSRPSSLACVPCRRRHLKCDARMPVCSRCLASNIDCGYVRSRRGLRGNNAAQPVEEPLFGTDSSLADWLNATALPSDLDVRSVSSLKYLEKSRN